MGVPSMSKEKKIADALKGMDKKSERYKKTKAYLLKRARPLEEKTVTVKHMDYEKTNSRGKTVHVHKNYGVPETVTLIAGKCPCSVCGHEWMWECEEASFETNGGCDCCSSTCT